MKSPWKKFAAFTAVVAVSLGMSLAESHAQSVARGRFKLPFDAKFQKVDLPSGDYTFAVNHLAMNGIVSIYQGTNSLGMFRVQSFNTSENKGENPVLIFVRHNGTTALRALTFPRAGTLYFALPKDLQNLYAHQPQLIETLSVQAWGN